MGQEESKLQYQIRLTVGAMPGVVIWRNQVGRAKKEYKGKTYYIPYGLVKGASDLIGIANGRFLAIEVKTPSGTPSPEQLLFIDLVNNMGGIAGIARSVEEAKRIVWDGLGITPS
jgi:hypothetical protein